MNQNRTPKGSKIALGRVVAPLGAHLARSWRLCAASGRSWSLLGASWGDFLAILAPRENLAIVEREARSKRELQARQERQEQREQQEQGEPERQHHEKEQCKSGKTSKSLQTAIQYDRLCPCSAATRPRRA